jgi:hypothetical protein
MQSSEFITYSFVFGLAGLFSMALYYKEAILQIPSFGRWFVNREGRLHTIVVRRVCPYCKGVMVPKKRPAHASHPAQPPVWECCRNPDHSLPYDVTEVEDAIHDGKLAHLFEF